MIDNFNDTYLFVIDNFNDTYLFVIDNFNDTYLFVSNEELCLNNEKQMFGIYSDFEGSWLLIFK